ncbi:MAG: J domain-containing protein [Oscillospiraceae bacterium]
MYTYRVLDINRNASEDEIKQAYKTLIKKYHPDNYVNNPLSNLALEKTKEINEAYDIIIKNNNNKKQSNFNKTDNYNNSQNGTMFQDIRNMINQNKVLEAEEVLNGIHNNQRNAEWHFLKGTIYYRKGWLEEAIKYFTNACQKEPNNAEYRMTLNRLQGQQRGNYNGNPYGGYNRGGNASACNCCSNLIFLDCCCECLGGDLISCC